MRKILVAITSTLLLLFATPAFATSSDSSEGVIPERNGDYQDPEHPDLRVHVFVHEPKPAKSSPTQSPSLVCPTDPNSTAVVPAAPWHLPSTWTYTLNPSSAPSTVGSGNLTTIANNAFSQWTNAINASGTKVTITKNPTDTTANRARFDGQNIIAWGRTQGTALAVTYTWYYTSGSLAGQAAEEDTIFNQKFPWYWNLANPTCTDSNSYDAQDILTHETGHWMGLDDTYDAVYVNNTMYGYGSKGETKKDTLTNGDITGVQAIYP